MDAPTQDRLASKGPLNVRLQHGLMRLACISALALLITLAAVRGSYPSYVYGLPPFTVLYHLFYALYLRSRLPGGVDLVIVLAEAACYLYFSSHLFPVNSLTLFPFVLIKVLGWLTFSILIPVIVLRIVRIYERETRLRSPEIVADTKAGDFNIDEIILGSLSPRHQLFIGEPRSTTILRAFWAAIIILAVSIFSTYNIIIEPMRETASPPVKDIRSFSIPQDALNDILQALVWNVLFTVPTPQIQDFEGVTVNMSVLLSAIEVSSISTTSQPCSYVRELGMPLSIPLGQYYSLMPSLTFSCPRNYTSLPGQPAGYVEQGPTILASVNFTKLSGFVTDKDSNPLAFPPLVQVMLGLTQKTVNVVTSTSPVPLIPGMNVVGLSNLYIRQIFYQPALSALGLFDVYDYFPVSEIGLLFPDPDTTPASSNMARSPDVANIRILSPNDFSNWRLIQDYRERSVLKGFAVVGGLWTFLCGVFAMVFGPSLLHLLFDIKPLSIFGLVHSLFKREREPFQRYRHLYDDLKAMQDRDKQNFNAFLAQYIIDFGPIQQASEAESIELLVTESNSNF